MGHIKTMFDPRTIALVGATEKEGSVGRVLLENLLAATGRQIFPINPGRETCMGEKCFRSLGDVPVHRDLVMVATPAPPCRGWSRSAVRPGPTGR
jgi:acetyltransferase